MVNHHTIAISARIKSSINHHPIGRGIDGGTLRRREIKPGVERALAGERIGAVAEARGDILQAGRQELRQPGNPAFEQHLGELERVQRARLSRWLTAVAPSPEGRRLGKRQEQFLADSDFEKYWKDAEFLRVLAATQPEN